MPSWISTPSRWQAGGAAPANTQSPGFVSQGCLLQGPDSVMSQQDTGGAGDLQVHCHRPRQHGVLVHLMQVLEPQQDTAEVCLGLVLSVLGTEGRWHEDSLSLGLYTLTSLSHLPPPSEAANTAPLRR